MTKKIPILMYHSLDKKPKGTVFRSLHVPPARFRNQMLMLKALGYKALSMRDLTPYLNGEKEDKVVGLTFDDGYKNNLPHAADLLKSLGFTATNYIVSDLIGEYNQWDMEKNVDKNTLMNHQEIRQWLAAGMDIGAHTRNHIDLQKVEPELAKAEIIECKEHLEREFGCTIKDFCYPYGSYNEQIATWVKEAGYTTATTTIRGRVTVPTADLFNLERVFIPYHTWPHLFLLRLFSHYEDKRRGR